MSPFELVARAAGGDAVVVGRPPPEGRDLDVVIRTKAVDRVVEELRVNGFRKRGDRWVRFRDSTVDIVDLILVESWHLPEHEVAELFTRAENGRPSPMHSLLIEAKRAALGGADTPSRRARVREALRAGAHGEAQRRANAWAVAELLPGLVSAASEPDDRATRRLHSIRPRRGYVVALSGLDGSGKSTQAAALRETLDRLGFPATTVWTRIALNPSLGYIGRPVKAAARLALRRSSHPPSPASPTREPGHGAVAREPGQELRTRYPLVNHCWLAIVATVNALSHWRAIAPHILRGRVVICDRYTLDSAAHLRYKYGPDNRFPLQARLVRLLSPTPIRAYLLDVAGDTAHARKPEKYTAEDLRVLAQIYREEAATTTTAIVNGERPRPQIAAELADDVLTALLRNRQRSARAKPANR